MRAGGLGAGGLDSEGLDANVSGDEDQEDITPVFFAAPIVDWNGVSPLAGQKVNKAPWFIDPTLQAPPKKSLAEITGLSVRVKE